LRVGANRGLLDAAGVSPGGEHFRVVAEMVAHTGIAVSRGFHAKVGLGVKRCGALHLGDAAVVLLIGRVLERSEQRGKFREERARESSINEGRLERRCRSDDGLRARHQRRVAAGARETERRADARMIRFQDAGGATNVFEVVAKIACRCDAEIDAALRFARASDLDLCGSQVEVAFGKVEAISA
jgi:hypothetical protein